MAWFYLHSYIFCFCTKWLNRTNILSSTPRDSREVLDSARHQHHLMLNDAESLRNSACDAAIASHSLSLISNYVSQSSLISASSSSCLLSAHRTHMLRSTKENKTQTQRSRHDYRPMQKSKQEVATGFGRHGMPPPASNDTGTAFFPRIKKRQRWDVQIMWAYDLDFWPWRSWRLWLMRVVVLHAYSKFEVRRPCHSEDMAHDVCQH